jgi:hypothetical protein
MLLVCVFLSYDSCSADEPFEYDSNCKWVAIGFAIKALCDEAFAYTGAFMGMTRTACLACPNDGAVRRKVA